MVVELALCKGSPLPIAKKKHGKYSFRSRSLVSMIDSDPVLREVFLELCYSRYKDLETAERVCKLNTSTLIRSIVIAMVRTNRYPGVVMDALRSLMTFGVLPGDSRELCEKVVEQVERELA